MFCKQDAYTPQSMGYKFQFGRLHTKPENVFKKTISKQECLKPFLDSEFNSVQSSKIAQDIERYIKGTRKYKKETPQFVEDVLNKLFYLHSYNLKTAEVTFKYPLTVNFRQLLLRYVVLEFNVLYRGVHTSKYENNVEARILRLLMNIYTSFYETSLNIPPKELLKRSAKSVLNFIIKVRTDYGIANKLIENIVRTLLSKIGVLEDVLALKEKSIPCLSDRYLGKLTEPNDYRNIITSDYGTDEDLVIKNDFMPVICDDDIEEINTNSDVGVVIKEEFDVSTVPQQFSDRLSKKVPTICLDDDDQMIYWDVETKSSERSEQRQKEENKRKQEHETRLKKLFSNHKPKKPSGNSEIKLELKEEVIDLEDESEDEEITNNSNSSIVVHTTAKESMSSDNNLIVEDKHVRSYKSREKTRTNFLEYTQEKDIIELSSSDEELDDKSLVNRDMLPQNDSKTIVINRDLPKFAIKLVDQNSNTQSKLVVDQVTKSVVQDAATEEVNLREKSQIIFSEARNSEKNLEVNAFPEGTPVTLDKVISSNKRTYLKSSYDNEGDMDNKINEIKETDQVEHISNIIDMSKETSIDSLLTEIRKECIVDNEETKTNKSISICQKVIKNTIIENSDTKELGYYGVANDLNNFESFYVKEACELNKANLTAAVLKNDQTNTASQLTNLNESNSHKSEASLEENICEETNLKTVRTSEEGSDDKYFIDELASEVTENIIKFKDASQSSTEVIETLKNLSEELQSESTNKASINQNTLENIEHTPHVEPFLVCDEVGELDMVKNNHEHTLEIIVEESTLNTCLTDPSEESTRHVASDIKLNNMNQLDATEKSEIDSVNCSKATKIKHMNRIIEDSTDINKQNVIVEIIPDVNTEEGITITKYAPCDNTIENNKNCASDIKLNNMHQLDATEKSEIDSVNCSKATKIKQMNRIIEDSTDINKQNVIVEIIPDVNTEEGVTITKYAPCDNTIENNKNCASDIKLNNMNQLDATEKSEIDSVNCSKATKIKHMNRIIEDSTDINKQNVIVEIIPDVNTEEGVTITKYAPCDNTIENNKNCASDIKLNNMNQLDATEKSEIDSVNCSKATKIKHMNRIIEDSTDINKQNVIAEIIPDVNTEEGVTITKYAPCDNTIENNKNCASDIKLNNMNQLDATEKSEIDSVNCSKATKIKHMNRIIEDSTDINKQNVIVEIIPDVNTEEGVTISKYAPCDNTIENNKNCASDIKLNNMNQLDATKKSEIDSVNCSKATKIKHMNRIIEDSTDIHKQNVIVEIIPEVNNEEGVTITKYAPCDNTIENNNDADVNTEEGVTTTKYAPCDNSIENNKDAEDSMISTDLGGQQESQEFSNFENHQLSSQSFMKSKDILTNITPKPFASVFEDLVRNVMLSSPESIEECSEPVELNCEDLVTNAVPLSVEIIKESKSEEKKASTEKHTNENIVNENDKLDAKSASIKINEETLKNSEANQKNVDEVLVELSIVNKENNKSDKSYKANNIFITSGVSNNELINSGHSKMELVENTELVEATEDLSASENASSKNDLETTQLVTTNINFLIEENFVDILTDDNVKSLSASENASSKNDLETTQLVTTNINFPIEENFVNILADDNVKSLSASENASSKNDLETTQLVTTNINFPVEENFVNILADDNVKSLSASENASSKNDLETTHLVTTNINFPIEENFVNILADDNVKSLSASENASSKNNLETTQLVTTNINFPIEENFVNILADDNVKSSSEDLNEQKSTFQKTNSDKSVLDTNYGVNSIHSDTEGIEKFRNTNNDDTAMISEMNIKEADIATSDQVNLALNEKPKIIEDITMNLSKSKLDDVNITAKFNNVDVSQIEAETNLEEKLNENTEIKNVQNSDLIMSDIETLQEATVEFIYDETFQENEQSLEFTRVDYNETCVLEIENNELANYHEVLIEEAQIIEDVNEQSSYVEDNVYQELSDPLNVQEENVFTTASNENNIVGAFFASDIEVTTSTDEEQEIKLSPENSNNNEEKCVLEKFSNENGNSRQNLRNDPLTDEMTLHNKDNVTDKLSRNVNLYEENLSSTEEIISDKILQKPLEIEITSANNSEQYILESFSNEDEIHQEITEHPVIEEIAQEVTITDQLYDTKYNPEMSDNQVHLEERRYTALVVENDTCPENCVEQLDQETLENKVDFDIIEATEEKDADVTIKVQTSTTNNTDHLTDNTVTVETMNNDVVSIIHKNEVISKDGNTSSGKETLQLSDNIIETKNMSDLISVEEHAINTSLDTPQNKDKIEHLDAINDTGKNTEIMTTQENITIRKNYQMGDEYGEHGVHEIFRETNADKVTLNNESVGSVQKVISNHILDTCDSHVNVVVENTNNFCELTSSLLYHKDISIEAITYNDKSNDDRNCLDECNEVNIQRKNIITDLTDIIEPKNITQLNPYNEQNLKENNEIDSDSLIKKLDVLKKIGTEIIVADANKQLVPEIVVQNLSICPVPNQNINLDILASVASEMSRHDSFKKKKTKRKSNKQRKKSTTNYKSTPKKSKQQSKIKLDTDTTISIANVDKRITRSCFSKPQVTESTEIKCKPYDFFLNSTKIPPPANNVYNHKLSEMVNLTSEDSNDSEGNLLIDEEIEIKSNPLLKEMEGIAKHKETVILDDKISKYDEDTLEENMVYFYEEKVKGTVMISIPDNFHDSYDILNQIDEINQNDCEANDPLFIKDINCDTSNTNYHVSAEKYDNSVKQNSIDCQSNSTCIADADIKVLNTSEISNQIGDMKPVRTEIGDFKLFRTKAEMKMYDKYNFNPYISIERLDISLSENKHKKRHTRSKSFDVGLLRSTEIITPRKKEILHVKNTFTKSNDITKFATHANCSKNLNVSSNLPTDLPESTLINSKEIIEETSRDDIKNEQENEDNSDLDDMPLLQRTTVQEKPRRRYGPRIVLKKTKGKARRKKVSHQVEMKDKTKETKKFKNSDRKRDTVLKNNDENGSNFVTTRLHTKSKKSQDEVGVDTKEISAKQNLDIQSEPNIKSYGKDITSMNSEQNLKENMAVQCGSKPKNKDRDIIKHETTNNPLENLEKEKINEINISNKKYYTTPKLRRKSISRDNLNRILDTTSTEKNSFANSTKLENNLRISNEDRKIENKKIVNADKKYYTPPKLRRKSVVDNDLLSKETGKKIVYNKLKSPSSKIEILSRCKNTVTPTTEKLKKKLECDFKLNFETILLEGNDMNDTNKDSIESQDELKSKENVTNSDRSMSLSDNVESSNVEVCAENEEKIKLIATDSDLKNKDVTNKIVAETDSIEVKFNFSDSLKNESDITENETEFHNVLPPSSDISSRLALVQSTKEAVPLLINNQVGSSELEFSSNSIKPIQSKDSNILISRKVKDNFETENQNVLSSQHVIEDNVGKVEKIIGTEYWDKNLELNQSVKGDSEKQILTSIISTANKVDESLIEQKLRSLNFEMNEIKEDNKQEVITIDSNKIQKLDQNGIMKVNEIQNDKEQLSAETNSRKIEEFDKEIKRNLTHTLMNTVEELQICSENQTIVSENSLVERLEETPIKRKLRSSSVINLNDIQKEEQMVTKIDSKRIQELNQVEKIDLAENLDIPVVEHQTHSIENQTAESTESFTKIIEHKFDTLELNETEKFQSSSENITNSEECSYESISINEISENLNTKTCNGFLKDCSKKCDGKRKINKVVIEDKIKNEEESKVEVVKKGLEDTVVKTMPQKASQIGHDKYIEKVITVSKSNKSKSNYLKVGKKVDFNSFKSSASLRRKGYNTSSSSKYRKRENSLKKNEKKKYEDKKSKSDSKSKSSKLRNSVNTNTRNKHIDPLLKSSNIELETGKKQEFDPSSLEKIIDSSKSNQSSAKFEENFVDVNKISSQQSAELKNTVRRKKRIDTCTSKQFDSSSDSIKLETKSYSEKENEDLSVSLENIGDIEKNKKHEHFPLSLENNEYVFKETNHQFSAESDIIMSTEENFVKIKDIVSEQDANSKDKSMTKKTKLKEMDEYNSNRNESSLEIEKIETKLFMEKNNENLTVVDVRIDDIEEERKHENSPNVEKNLDASKSFNEFPTEFSITSGSEENVVELKEVDACVSKQNFSDTVKLETKLYSEDDKKNLSTVGANTDDIEKNKKNEHCLEEISSLENKIDDSKKLNQVSAKLNITPSWEKNEIFLEQDEKPRRKLNEKDNENLNTADMSIENIKEENKHERYSLNVKKNIDTSKKFEKETEVFLEHVEIPEDKSRKNTDNKIDICISKSFENSSNIVQLNTKSNVEKDNENLNSTDMTTEDIVKENKTDHCSLSLEKNVDDSRNFEKINEISLEHDDILEDKLRKKLNNKKIDECAFKPFENSSNKIESKTKAIDEKVNDELKTADANTENINKEKEREHDLLSLEKNVDDSKPLEERNEISLECDEILEDKSTKKLNKKNIDMCTYKQFENSSNITELKTKSFDEKDFEDLKTSDAHMEDIEKEKEHEQCLLNPKQNVDDSKNSNEHLKEVNVKPISKEISMEINDTNSEQDEKPKDNSRIVKPNEKQFNLKEHENLSNIVNLETKSYDEKDNESLHVVGADIDDLKKEEKHEYCPLNVENDVNNSKTSKRFTTEFYVKSSIEKNVDDSLYKTSLKQDTKSENIPRITPKEKEINMSISKQYEKYNEDCGASDMSLIMNKEDVDKVNEHEHHSSSPKNYVNATSSNLVSVESKLDEEEIFDNINEISSKQDSELKDKAERKKTKEKEIDLFISKQYKNSSDTRELETLSFREEDKTNIDDTNKSIEYMGREKKHEQCSPKVESNQFSAESGLKLSTEENFEAIQDDTNEIYAKRSAQLKDKSGRKKTKEKEIDISIRNKYENYLDEVKLETKSFREKDTEDKSALNEGKDEEKEKKHEHFSSSQQKKTDYLKKSSQSSTESNKKLSTEENVGTIHIGINGKSSEKDVRSKNMSKEKEKSETEFDLVMSKQYEDSSYIQNLESRSHKESDSTSISDAINFKNVLSNLEDVEENIEFKEKETNSEVQSNLQLMKSDRSTNLLVQKIKTNVERTDENINEINCTIARNDMENSEISKQDINSLDIQDAVVLVEQTKVQECLQNLTPLQISDNINKETDITVQYQQVTEKTNESSNIEAHWDKNEKNEGTLSNMTSVQANSRKSVTEINLDEIEKQKESKETYFLNENIAEEINHTSLDHQNMINYKKNTEFLIHNEKHEETSLSNDNNIQEPKSFSFDEEKCEYSDKEPNSSKVFKNEMSTKSKKIYDNDRREKKHKNIEEAFEMYLPTKSKVELKNNLEEYSFAKAEDKIQSDNLLSDKKGKYNPQQENIEKVFEEYLSTKSKVGAKDDTKGKLELNLAKTSKNVSPNNDITSHNDRKRKDVAEQKNLGQDFDRFLPPKSGIELRENKEKKSEINSTIDTNQKIDEVKTFQKYDSLSCKKELNENLDLKEVEKKLYEPDIKISDQKNGRKRRSITDQKLLKPPKIFVSILDVPTKKSKLQEVKVEVSENIQDKDGNTPKQLSPTIKSPKKNRKSIELIISHLKEEKSCTPLSSDELSNSENINEELNSTVEKVDVSVLRRKLLQKINNPTQEITVTLQEINKSKPMISKDSKSRFNNNKAANIKVKEFEEGSSSIDNVLKKVESSNSVSKLAGNDVSLKLKVPLKKEKVINNQLEKSVAKNKNSDISFNSLIDSTSPKFVEKNSDILDDGKIKGLVTSDTQELNKVLNPNIFEHTNKITSDENNRVQYSDLKCSQEYKVTDNESMSPTPISSVNNQDQNLLCKPIDDSVENLECTELPFDNIVSSLPIKDQRQKNRKHLNIESEIGSKNISSSTRTSSPEILDENKSSNVTTSEMRYTGTDSKVIVSDASESTVCNKNANSVASSLVKSENFVSPLIKSTDINSAKTILEDVNLVSTSGCTKSFDLNIPTTVTSWASKSQSLQNMNSQLLYDNKLEVPTEINLEKPIASVSNIIVTTIPKKQELSKISEVNFESDLSLSNEKNDQNIPISQTNSGIEILSNQIINPVTKPILIKNVQSEYLTSSNTSKSVMNVGFQNNKIPVDESITSTSPKITAHRMMENEQTHSFHELVSKSVSSTTDYPVDSNFIKSITADNDVKLVSSTTISSSSSSNQMLQSELDSTNMRILEKEKCRENFLPTVTTNSLTNTALSISALDKNEILLNSCVEFPSTSTEDSNLLNLSDLMLYVDSIDSPDAVCMLSDIISTSISSAENKMQQFIPTSQPSTSKQILDTNNCTGKIVSHNNQSCLYSFNRQMNISNNETLNSSDLALNLQDVSFSKIPIGDSTQSLDLISPKSLSMVESTSSRNFMNEVPVYNDIINRDIITETTCTNEPDDHNYTGPFGGPFLSERSEEKDILSSTFDNPLQELGEFAKNNLREQPEGKHILNGSFLKPLNDSPVDFPLNDNQLQDLSEFSENNLSIPDDNHKLNLDNEYAIKMLCNQASSEANAFPVSNYIDIGKINLIECNISTEESSIKKEDLYSESVDFVEKEVSSDTNPWSHFIENENLHQKVVVITNEQCLTPPPILTENDFRLFTEEIVETSSPITSSTLLAHSTEKLVEQKQEKDEKENSPDDTIQKKSRFKVQKKNVQKKSTSKDDIANHYPRRIYSRTPVTASTKKKSLPIAVSHESNNETKENSNILQGEIVQVLIAKEGIQQDKPLTVDKTNKTLTEKPPVINETPLTMFTKMFNPSNSNLNDVNSKSADTITSKQEVDLSEYNINNNSTSQNLSTKVNIQNKEDVDVEKKYQTVANLIKSSAEQNVKEKSAQSNNVSNKTTCEDLIDTVKTSPENLNKPVKDLENDDVGLIVQSNIADLVKSRKRAATNKYSSSYSYQNSPTMKDVTCKTESVKPKSSTLKDKSNTDVKSSTEIKSKTELLYPVQSEPERKRRCLTQNNLKGQKSPSLADKSDTSNEVKSLVETDSKKKSISICIKTSDIQKNYVSETVNKSLSKEENSLDYLKTYSTSSPKLNISSSVSTKSHNKISCSNYSIDSILNKDSKSSKDGITSETFFKQCRQSESKGSKRNSSVIEEDNDSRNSTKQIKLDSKGSQINSNNKNATFDELLKQGNINKLISLRVTEDNKLKPERRNSPLISSSSSRTRERNEMNSSYPKKPLDRRDKTEEIRSDYRRSYNTYQSQSYASKHKRRDGHYAEPIRERGQNAEPVKVRGVSLSDVHRGRDTHHSLNKKGREEHYLYHSRTKEGSFAYPNKEREQHRTGYNVPPSGTSTGSYTHPSRTSAHDKHYSSSSHSTTHHRPGQASGSSSQQTTEPCSKRNTKLSPEKINELLNSVKEKVLDQLGGSDRKKKKSDEGEYLWIEKLNQRVSDNTYLLGTPNASTPQFFLKMPSPRADHK